MNLIKTPVQDLYIMELNRLSDNRGYFERMFCKDFLENNGIQKDIVQINHSCTWKKGSVRGMHYQIPPKAEMKFVKCIKGEAFDVAIDLRKDSATFLKWHGEIISESNNKAMIIPEGFAHGFQTLSDNTELIYFHSQFYSLEHERRIKFDDPKIGINWILKVADLSDKDLNVSYINEYFEGIIL